MAAGGIDAKRLQRAEGSSRRATVVCRVRQCV